MKKLKLLNKKYLLYILFSLFFGFSTQSQEVVDIWNVKENEATKKDSVFENIKKKIYQKIKFMKCSPKKLTD